MMPLPRAARLHLTTDLSDAISSPSNPTSFHSLPISAPVWDRYTQILHEQVKELIDYCSLDNLSEIDEATTLKEASHEIFALFRSTLWTLQSLASFKPYSPEIGEQLTSLLKGSVATARSKLLQEATDDSALDELRVCWSHWPANDGTPDKEVLGQAFNLQASQVRDEHGEFSVAKVLSSYYLNNGDLIQEILPHIISIGLPPVTDVAHLTSIVGSICSATDPVAACRAATSFFAAFVVAEDKSPILSERLRTFLRGREQYLFQSRKQVNRLMALLDREMDEEAHALLFPDIYRRLVEGGAKLFLWAQYVLETGEWCDLPMLTGLRERALSHGGWLAIVTDVMVLVSARNAAAHEDIVWDGFTQTYKSNDEIIEPVKLVSALVCADAYFRGCSAALMCFEGIHVVPTLGAPTLDEEGRLAPYQRALALLGSNGLDVLSSNFNGREASIHCKDFRVDNINPCFQGLTASHVLLPDVVSYKILVGCDREEVMRVGRDALSVNYPLWERAFREFSAIPLCAFLPVNFDARRHQEGETTAIKSIAWIALDDALDAIDGCPSDEWADNLDLLEARLAFNLFALNTSSIIMPNGGGVRIAFLREAVQGVLKKFSRRGSDTASWQLLERNPEMQRLRDAFEVWRPADRLPAVKKPSMISQEDDRRPEFRDQPTDLNWRTI